MITDCVALVAAISLTKYDQLEAAREQFARFESMYSIASKEVQTADADVVLQRQLLIDALQQTYGQLQLSLPRSADTLI